jgi:hypothetical protein
VYEIERLTLLQNIADMQHQVEEAEVQVAAFAGYSGLTATASSTGSSGGAAGSVWSGSDELGRTTVTDSPASPTGSGASVGN